MKEQNSRDATYCVSTVFAILIALMLTCVLTILFLFGEWTYINLLNILLIIVIACAGAIVRNRKGWYIITSGAVTVSFSYFISYCRTEEGYLGYIYAVAFTMSMFTFSYFLSPRFQLTFFEKGRQRGFTSFYARRSKQ